MNIKRTFIKSLSAVALLSAVACSEDRLDLQPYNQANNTGIFTDADLIREAVNGMYNAAQRGDYNGTGRGYPFGAAYHQQNDLRGEDVVSTALFYNFTYTSNINTFDSLNNIYYWQDTYRLINRANLLIEGLEKALSNGVITQAVHDQYLGEALFFRAISHFELLKHFSRPIHVTSGNHKDYGVPYLTKGSEDLVSYTNNFDAGSDRGTVEESYVKVLADLDRAEQLMGSKTTVYKASKEAAIAYKTIVKLHKRDWQGVIDEANKLEGKFTLGDSPNTVFANNASNSESIFSLEHSATNNPTNNGALAAMTIGRGLIAISPILWNDAEWLADDKRRSSDLVIEREVKNRSGAVIGKSMITNKYKDATTRTDAAPIVRYAEVLLNRAEAKARLGDASYLADLNAVRNRSLANPATQAYTSFGSTEAAVKAILKERRIEFIGEGKRWGDIHRLINDDVAPTTGVPAKHRNGVPAVDAYSIGTVYTPDIQSIDYNDKKFLWPIPQSVISVNPTLKAQQNYQW